MKKMFALFLCAAMLFALCACDQGTEDPSSDSRTKIDIWLPMQESYDMAWWNAQFDAYNAQSETYYVKISWVDMSAWDSKILAARENGTAPDVVTYSIGGVAQQALYGTLSPINDYIEDLDEYLKDYDEKIVANITDINGDVYGIPRFIEPSMLLFYRKDILSAAGWNEAPKSLAELEQCCADVKAHLDANPSVGINYSLQVGSTNDDYGWVSWAIQAQLSGHESSLNADWTKADLSGYEKVAEYWADLHDMEGVASQGLTSGGYKDIYAAIWEGKVAMQQCGSWIWGNLQTVEDYAYLRDKIGVAPWPTESGETDGQILCSVGGYSLAIERGSDCPEGAADFIKWCLLSEESVARQYDFFEAGNFCKFSARKAVNDMILENVGAENELANLVINTLLPNAMVEPTYPWEISQFLGNAYVAYVAGGMTSAEAIAGAEANINGYIAANGVADNIFN